MSERVKASEIRVKASEILALKIGPKVLTTDVEMRAVYNTLRALERHHETEHADCEERWARDLALMIELAAPASGRTEL